MASIELPALYVDSVVALQAVTRPMLVNRDPGPNEIGVPIHSAIAVEIVDTGTFGLNRIITRIWVNSEIAFDGSNIPEILAGFSGPQSQVNETADTLRIVLDPVNPFTSQEIVEVHVITATIDGEELDDYYSFTVEDLTAPRLIAAQAVSAKSIRIEFDEDILVEIPNGLTVTPLDRPAVTPLPVEADAEGAIVKLTFDTEMSPGKRYRLEASGVTDVHGNSILPPFDSVTFTGFVPAKPQDRRFDLWTMIPVWNRREDVTGDLWRFIACLQEAGDLLIGEVDRFPDIFDLERAPESFLDIILLDLGNPFPFELDELGKRRLASVLVEMYRQKGTAIGIENAIRFFLGIDITSISPFTLTTLILGESELGIDWELGPSDRFARYAFNVDVDIPLSDSERRQLRAIVEYMKPAHTHFVDLLEPSAPIDYAHWELGVSELGLSTDLH